MGAIDAARWQKLEPLLDEALQLPVAERAHWLSELRERSAELADTLSALLAEQSAANSSGFLAEPFKLPLSGASLAGFQLGSYTLERPIGDGGMGSVWLARQMTSPNRGLTAPLALASLDAPRRTHALALLLGEARTSGNCPAARCRRGGERATVPGARARRRYADRCLC